MVLDDIKKVAEENGIELTPEMLDAVAGGAFTPEEWANFTPEERQRLAMESITNKTIGKPCCLD
ncbi:MAG: hypothetical protein IKE65_03920 [Clostridia bacterium]|nr:hypothetical protein [Clostridia bacterium]